MAADHYDPVATEADSAPLLDNQGAPAPRRASVESNDSGSDIVYRDVLDADPFEEKRPAEHDRFADESGYEEGIGFPSGQSRLRPRKKSRKILAVLIVIVIAAGAIGVLAASGYSAPSYAIKAGNKHITMDHIFNGTFRAHQTPHTWVKEAADGTYSQIDELGNILLHTVQEPNKTRILVKSVDIKDPRDDTILDWETWRLSADMKYVLFSTNYKKQWRHSQHSNYFVFRLSDLKTFPLHPPKPADDPSIAYAKWSPIGHAIAYVSDNDLYVARDQDLESNDPKATRITHDGSAVVFNGVPDWVYEEEVFAADFALWWSPKADTVAFLRSNETAVQEYKVQYYNKDSNDAFAVNPYTTEVAMRYPKPGTPLPIVNVHTFSLTEFWGAGGVGVTTPTKRMPLSASKHVLTWQGEYPSDNRIIVEVAWVSDNGLIVKEIDRAARKGQVVLFEDGKSEGKVVRTLGKDGEEGDDGWIDHGQHLTPVTSMNGASGYLDIVPNKGFDHIALFTPINSTEPVFITEGEWEVTALNAVDKTKNLLYFTAANPSIDRHIYSVSLPTDPTLVSYKPEMKAITDTAEPGYYEASFSPNGGFYSLNYKGPKVPWQRMIQTEEGGINRLITDNSLLNETIAEFHRPIETHSTFKLEDGTELNMMEILPPNIDTSGRKRYPLLIQVYGGPYSQTVSHEFKRDWHSFLACEQKYIIARIDGRGTGFRGRKIRNPIKDDLGRYEVEDQIALAQEMIKRKYVDRKRVGIWGWSYGGFMTLKTLEANPALFTLGMAVAPVTNWRYYDSIYTERYMNTPEANPSGYVSSAVNNVTNFEGKDLLLAHGTGDDNVHFANMASLLDKLTQSKVRGWRMRAFTDSAHSILTRGANRELYEWMTAYLVEKWGTGGGHTK